jgi:biotin transport system substrate-specific component
LKKSETRTAVVRIVFTALFAALFVVFSHIRITLGISPVPFTLQSFAIMLIGGLLGPRHGFISLALVLALTALGLPLISEGGWSVMTGRTAGFIWLFPVSAWLIGWFSRRIRGRGVLAWLSLAAVMELFGSLLLYAGGVPWFSRVTGLSLAESFALAAAPFLVTDLLKALLAAGIVLALRPAMPDLESRRVML